MINRIKNYVMNKKDNYMKEIFRGSIKELMKTHGLRSISFANYDKFRNVETDYNVHTVNINIENGYLRFYGYNEKNNVSRRGNLIADVTLDMYKNSYNRALEILENANGIPNNVRRNILVSVYR